MNVLLDDVVDGIFNQVQDSLVPTIEAVTQKATKELKNRLQTPPSSVDLLYLTDRLIVSSQPAPSSSPSYIDNGRDKRSTAHIPQQTSGSQTGNPAKRHDNDISRKEESSQQESAPNATENLSEKAPEASMNARRAEITDPYECGEMSTKEKTASNQSLDSQDRSISNGNEGKIKIDDTENIHGNANRGNVSTSATKEAIHDSDDASSSRIPFAPKNSPGILTSFLDKRHGSDHYLAFSLMDEQPDDRILLLFRRQIVQLGWWSPCPERSETPSIPDLLRACYAIHAYLKLHPQNVALVYCSNGKTRTAITVACYLKFAGIVKYSQEGFFHFLSKRGVQNPEATWKQLPPSLRLFFHQFDTALSIGGYLNRKPLQLRAIALQGVPVEDKPCLDIWDSSQRHVYSSHPEIWASNSTQHINPSTPSQWIDEEGFYKVDVCLDGDFLLLCRFGGDFAKDTAMHDPSKILFRYSNNTGFLAGGCPYELPSKKVDLTRRYALHLDHEDFLVTLLFQADWEGLQPGKTETSQSILPERSFDPLKAKEGVLSGQVWRSHDRQAFDEGLKVIFQHHSARPDASDIMTFRNRHDERVFEKCAGHLICLALQLTNFNQNETKDLLLTSPSFTWWRLHSNCDPLTETSLMPSRLEDDKSNGPKKEEMDLKQDSDRPQKMLGMLDTINISQNLDSKDIASFKVLDSRRKLHETNSDSRNTPKRRNSAIHRRKQPGIEAFCNDVGWMVPGMTYPRAGDIVRGFSAEYMGLDSRFPTTTLSSVSLPKVPFQTDLNSILYKGRTSTATNFQRSNQIRRYDRQRDISTQILLTIGHTGVTLPCLLDVLRESQKWDGAPPNEHAKMENDGNDLVGNAAPESTEGSMNRKSKEQKEKGWKEARNAEEKKKTRSKDAEGKSSSGAGELSAGQEEENAASLIPLKDDPEYSKFFKMVKLGMPLAQVEHAMKREEKDPLVLQLDPEKSLEEQTPEQPEIDAGDVSLKDNPEYEKYFKMLKMGLPRDAVKNALLRDGKDPSTIDLDPAKSLSSQSLKPSEDENSPLKDDPDYKKYFKMLKMGMPVGAVKNALIRDGKDPKIIDLDPSKSLKLQSSSNEDTGIALKDDPEYAKYFKMIGMGLPVDAVKNALMRDGKDPDVLDLDPGKSVQFQLGKNGKQDTGIPLKDDPEYAKYFKMLGMGLPLGAVKNALERDGKDPNMLDLDPEKSVAYQLKESAASKKSPTKKKKRVRRKKIYWNPIDPGKLKENSMWHIVRDAVNMTKLNYDQKEFEELFTESTDPKDAKKTKKPEKATKKLVQVIDPKRSMNGGIILARLKIDYAKIADIVNKMERSKFDSTQLSALKEFLADPDERRELIGYMQNTKMPKEVLYGDLSETEKYMYTMMDIPGASEKIDAMLFRCVFKNRFDDVNAGINTLNSACDQLRSSEKLRKLMAMILTVVNEINTGGEGNMAIGFTLDALLKLNEAKAFDKKTSVLHYVVKLVKKNDSRLLTFSNDISSVIPAESVLLDSLANEVKSLGQELVGVHQTVQGEAERLEEAGELRPMTLEDLKEQRTTVRQVGHVSQFNKMDHHTGRTPMERFMVNAKYSCDQAIISIEEVRKKFLAALQYFGEDENMPTGDFFGILRRFMREFQKAVDQVEAIEKKEAKERKRAVTRAAKAAAKAGDKSIGRTKKDQHGGDSALPAKAKSKRVVKIPEKRDFGGTTTTGSFQAIGSTRDSGKLQTRSDLLSAMAAAAASRKGLQSGGIHSSTRAQAKDINSIANTEKKSGSFETGGIGEETPRNQETLPPRTTPESLVHPSEVRGSVSYTQKTQSSKEEMHQTISPKAIEKSPDANATIASMEMDGQSVSAENDTPPCIDSQKPSISKQRQDIVNVQHDAPPFMNSDPVIVTITASSSSEQEHGEVSTNAFGSDKSVTESTKAREGIITGVEEHQETKEPQTKEELSSAPNTTNSVHQGEASDFYAEAMQNGVKFKTTKPSDNAVVKGLGSALSQRIPPTAEGAMKNCNDPTEPIREVQLLEEQTRQSRFNESALQDEKARPVHVVEASNSKDSQGPTAVQAASVKESFSEPRDLDEGRSTIDPPHQGVTTSALLGNTSNLTSLGSNDPSPMEGTSHSVSALASASNAPLYLQLIQASSSASSNGQDLLLTGSQGTVECSQQNDSGIPEEVQNVSENAGRIENDEAQNAAGFSDDVSVTETIPKGVMEVRMSQTWADGEDITNWMPWAGEVIKACDSDSVVGFEIPRDLNDGSEFDDDSTIASSASFASYYDDSSVGSGFNTPGKMPPTQHPTTSPFDPYFDNVEQSPNQFMIDTRGGLTASNLFDDVRSHTANVSHPPPRHDVGLDSGLSFGANFGFDDGLGGFGAISNIDSTDDNGRDNSKTGAENKRKNAWFPWGGGN